MTKDSREDRELRAARIRELNDKFRTMLTGGRIVMTVGIQALPAETVKEVLRVVTNFKDFSTDNDPHGEHDFGAFDVSGEKFFFKLDYYDKSMEFGSPDPADPVKTTRVLTIMLASEW